MSYETVTTAILFVVLLLLLRGVEKRHSKLLMDSRERLNALEKEVRIHKNFIERLIEDREIPIVWVRRE
jgi:hypothetical protein